MSEIDDLKQALINVTPYYVALMHDISNLIYDAYTDDAQALVCSQYAGQAALVAPALIRDNDTLRAENARLRKALERIINMILYPTSFFQTDADIRIIASAALDWKEPQ
jgi:hypothetical protein